MFATKICGRSFSRSVSLNGSIKHVTIIGSGFMGADIAQTAAQTGYTVVLTDYCENALKKAETRIEDNIRRAAKKKFGTDQKTAESFILESVSRITKGTNYVAAVKSADLVVEAIVENLSEKQKLFAELDKVAPEHTIFTTNTSSLSVEKVMKFVSRKDRCGGLHFFFPVSLVKLLEVIPIPATSEETTASMIQWGKSLGKVTVMCKDTPGFIVNRLLIPYMLETTRMYERGDASKEDIDKALKLGAGFPIGPFELSDYVGLDVLYNILKEWKKTFPDNPQYEIPKSLEKLVMAGKYGRKTGEGYYTYK